MCCLAACLPRGGVGAVRAVVWLVFSFDGKAHKAGVISLWRFTEVCQPWPEAQVDSASVQLTQCPGFHDKANIVASHSL